MRGLTVVLGVLAVCLTAIGSAAADSLVAQWHLDSKSTTGSADFTADSSGHGLSAASAPGMVLGAGGRFGNAILPANTGLLEPAQSPLFQPAQLTLMAWVRATTPGTLKYIAGRGDDGGTCSGPSYALYTGVNPTDGLQFFIRPTVGAYIPSPSAGTTLWNGQWHMIAGSFDGARVHLYVDGNEVGTGSLAAGKAVNYGFVGNNFFFDGYPLVCPGGDFPGSIDEVRLYDRALNPTELRRLAQAAGPDPPVLVPDGDQDGAGDAADLCPTISAAAPDGCPPPVLGKQVNAVPLRGTVYVSLPAGAAHASATVPGLKGRIFVPLTTGRQIPVGSFVDTRAGSVRLISSSTVPGGRFSGSFTSGVFQVVQSAKRPEKGLTELRLKGASFKNCTASAKRSLVSSSKRKKRSRRTVRKLRGDAQGRFRTSGRYSSATVRGTDWTVADRCDGTLTTVKRGKVLVRDFKRRKNVLVKPGKRYLARAPG